MSLVLLSTPAWPFIPKNHWLPFLALMHLGVALPGGVLGRARRVDDGGIDDRAGVHRHAATLQVAPDLLEEPGAKAVALKQTPELAQRRLIGRRLRSQVDSRKGTHRRRFVQRFFHRRAAPSPLGSTGSIRAQRSLHG